MEIKQPLVMKEEMVEKKIKNIKQLRMYKLMIGIFMLLTLAVNAQSNKTNAFTLFSDAFVNNGPIAKLNTCDSLGISPQLAWSNAPVGTKGYAITMHHFPKTGEKLAYIVLYDIAANINYLPAGATSVGTWGMNSHSNKPGYAPPCSKGPGAKKYIITIYALSEQPKIVNTYPIKIDQLLAAINGHVLDSAILTVQHTR